MRSFLLFTIAISFSILLPAQEAVTKAQIQQAEQLFDLSFTNAKRDSMLDAVADKVKTYRYLHAANLSNDVPYPLWYSPLTPQLKVPLGAASFHYPIPEQVELPNNKSALAFYSIPQLASLLRHKKITSVALTHYFLDRLKQYGAQLHCVIELTDTLALAEARKADADFAKGIYKSILQGIPYGIKDLFAVKGTHTTWGTPPYQQQIIQETSFVAQQLEKAGAVLVAKLSLGELAMDDVWFGGMTRNPWDTSKGSGGSSAGSAAATVAGLVPFAIGTETYGSIVDPSARCGATGLRPTYGSIAKTGGMNLAWSSDKIGALCRSAEDAAIVFNYIHGADQTDRSSIAFAFKYRPNIPIQALKVAYISNYIDTLPDNSPEKQFLQVLKQQGIQVSPIPFPDTLHADELLSLIIGVESAAAFDPLTRSNKDDDMVQQHKDRWPNTFRSARFVPGVEYINACRMRYTIMERMGPMIDQYDVIIAPPETGEQLAITNLTGNPSVTFPIAFNKNGMPVAISCIGKHFGEARLLAFVQHFQHSTSFHQKHPAQFMQ